MDDGALVSYGSDLGKRAALADRILEAPKPANLPVEQPTVFRLVMNLKTASALGFATPTSIPIRADEVIEKSGSAKSGVVASKST